MADLRSPEAMKYLDRLRSLLIYQYLALHNPSDYVPFQSTHLHRDVVYAPYYHRFPVYEIPEISQLHLVPNVHHLELKIERSRHAMMNGHLIKKTDLFPQTVTSTVPIFEPRSNDKLDQQAHYIISAFLTARALNGSLVKTPTYAPQTMRVSISTTYASPNMGELANSDDEPGSLYKWDHISLNSVQNMLHFHGMILYTVDGKFRGDDFPDGEAATDSIEAIDFILGGIWGIPTWTWDFGKNEIGQMGVEEMVQLGGKDWGI